MTETFAPRAPSYTTARTTRARVLRAGFGDGYSQRAGDGLNSVVNSWSVVWNALTSDEADYIDGFLAARGGHEAFSWTAPGEDVPRLWICESWSRTPRRAGDSRGHMAATFEEAFALV
ncbi:MAG: phage tail protein [Alphaproteobacteria bacterium]